MWFNRTSKPATDSKESGGGEKRTAPSDAPVIWHGLERALEGREPSNTELAAALREAAAYGAFPPARIRAVIARRIEEAELALLRMRQELIGDAPPRA